MQEAYAQLAVADFWRVRGLTAEGESARTAQAQCADRRRQAAKAVEELAGSDALTPLGERFVAGMTSRLHAID